MRGVHLIKEIEDTIKRGPKSKSRFTTVNTPILGWLQGPTWPDFAAQPSASLATQSLLCSAVSFDLLEVHLTQDHLAGVTSGAAPARLLCGVYTGGSVWTSAFISSSEKKKKKKEKKPQSKHYLLLITCKVGLLPLPQFLRALKWNLKEATYCFQLCKSQEQTGLKLQLWKATGNWQPGNLLPTIHSNKGYIPPKTFTIRNPRLVYLVGPTE